MVDPDTQPGAGSPSDTVLCPRCSAGFECKVREGGCWCAEVTIDDHVRADFARFYDGCLCPDCLKTIEDARPPKPDVWAFLKKNFKRTRAS